MLRLSGLLSIILAIFCASLLFWTSQSVQKAERELAKAEQQNEAEEEMLRVLSAEWNYLNRPERLEQLTKGNLDLDEPLADSKNFISSADSIPQPVVPVLPKIKPVFVGGLIVSEEKKEADIIDQNNRDDFNRLIKSVSENGGAP